ncbi:HD domain-containing protein [Gordonia sp. HY442]|uniref:HD domain-containing protein n=1 Tax=Gordonia zhenghanii TaxID=2911516 RepID=UPI001F1677EE|nr:HD domain-containing protein [Gordonia zhenghanii]MCF8606940.1 HD domain-containing protein [Gordonia zhenghanii]
MRIGELTRSQCVVVAVTGTTAATLAVPGYLHRVRHEAGGELVRPPDSRYAREVVECAVDELSPAVLAHSYRCFQWSTAFAAIDGLRVDPEQLWAAAMLHDLALGGPDVAGFGCFAAISGEAAARLVARHRTTEDAEAIRNAIAVHFHPREPDEPVAHSLHSAVNLDVVGYRLRELDAKLVTATEAARPREGFREEFGAAMRVEVRRRPRSAAAVLWRAGARLPLASNPLERGAPRSPR